VTSLAEPALVGSVAYWFSIRQGGDSESVCRRPSRSMPMERHGLATTTNSHRLTRQKDSLVVVELAPFPDNELALGARPDPIPGFHPVNSIARRKTLSSWRTEILAHRDTGASNGSTEGLNLCVKKVKRCGHGSRPFENDRLRVLLHAGGVTWPARPRPPRVRTRSPYPDA
jgi:hypothetical protein